jgi:hypothetical protein
MEEDPVSTPWWQGIPSVDATLECSKTQHRLQWQAGQLSALDHADAEGERVLAAIGGERCACIEFLDIWARHSDDLRVLTLASRGTGDRPELTDDHLQHGFLATTQLGTAQHLRRVQPGRQAGWVGRAPLSGTTRARAVFTTAQATAGGPPGQTQPQFPQEEEVLSVLAVSPTLWDRLVDTVLATWADRLSTSGRGYAAQQPALTAALFGRAGSAIRHWHNDPSLVVSLEMISAEQPALLLRQPEGIRAQLPFRWLIDIWAMGLAVVLGRFTLATIDSINDSQQVLTVDKDLGDVRPLTISLG